MIKASIGLMVGSLCPDRLAGSRKKKSTHRWPFYGVTLGLLLIVVLVNTAAAQSPGRPPGPAIGPAAPGPGSEGSLVGPPEEIPAWQARWELARLLAYSKKYGEALEEYRKVLKEKPDLVEARGEMAKVLYWAGQQDEALKMMEQLPGGQVSPEMLLIKADLLAAAKRYPEAEELYKAYLHNNPADLAARFKLAQILSWMKKYLPALTEYETILKARPDDFQVRRHYALVLSWAGRHQEAAEELKKSLAGK